MRFLNMRFLKMRKIRVLKYTLKWTNTREICIPRLLNMIPSTEISCSCSWERLEHPELSKSEVKMWFFEKKVYFSGGIRDENIQKSIFLEVSATKNKKKSIFLEVSATKSWLYVNKYNKYYIIYYSYIIKWYYYIK